MVRTVKTLDDLTDELQKAGFSLSRSAVYLRLQPRNIRSQEGKRHVTTAPVKLARCRNDKHSAHQDGKFARASISYLEELSSALGPEEVTFHSQDDKARVPIGITAAQKQSPLLLSMEYKVTLSDHDFVVAPSHKLIPSVIAGIDINKDTKEAVTYSGPTYVALRSAKHSSSTAFAHLHDMKRIHELDQFKRDLYDQNGLVKPIFICTVDGGPDENPRYHNTIRCAVDYFCTYDLDALFLATNAPGRSAFNRVERRMAPLSHDLAGLVLPHNHFGDHLDNSGNTKDEDLERKNFAHAGKTLAEVWSDTVIDGHPVVAEYVEDVATTDIQSKDASWHSVHVRESQYFLQIVKCSDTSCCKPMRSSLLTVLPSRFIPAPVPLKQTPDGLKFDMNGSFPSIWLNQTISTPSGTVFPDRVKRKFPSCLPYDLACESIQESLVRRTCKCCNLYFASIKSMNIHAKDCHKNEEPRKRVRPTRLAARRQCELMCVIANELEWMDEEDVDTENLAAPPQMQRTAGTPVIRVQERQLPWEA